MIEWEKDELEQCQKKIISFMLGEFKTPRKSFTIKILERYNFYEFTIASIPHGQECIYA